MLVSAGRLTFAQIMKMFRNDLLDLNDILNYIRLAPQDSPATSPAVSNPPPGNHTVISSCPTLPCALFTSEAAVSVSALLWGVLTQCVNQCSAVSLMSCSESTHKKSNTISVVRLSQSAEALCAGCPC